MLRMLIILGCMLAQAAQAQVGIPAVRLPTLPQMPLPQELNQAVPTGVDALNPRDLSTLRELRIRDLIRAHGALIERDPHGAPIVRNELIAFSPSEQALAAVRAAGFVVAREHILEGLDERIVVLRVPTGVRTERALKQLQSLDPQGIYDFNHIYTDSASISASTQSATEDTRADVVQASGAHVKVGLIDGGVALTHTVFHDASVHQHGCNDKSVPSEHGTAVASLMVGSSAQFHGAAPGAELFAADVYCGEPTGGAADAVADAFAWLVHAEVPVINVSLVGPPNLLLENVVRRVILRGCIIVAAVGNDGPAAPPLYPAAYPDVVGVTAVDRRDRVLPEAARGKQVVFAAPGADMAAASIAHEFAMVRGTSFAAPIVAGLLAAPPRTLERATAEEAIAALARRAIDLGASGPDPIYGNGLVGDSLRPPLSLAAAR
jgi:hypothetical protein